MQHDHGSSSMHQQIFKLGLSTESVSAYLLCCGLADEGKSVSTKNLMEIWPGTPSSLKQGIRDLQERRILRMIVSDGEENTVYQLTDVHEWVDN
ncbi:MAG TPA: hypothetical protein HPQ03_17740 [Deltaproteobacteria bacterium]|nr:hypothetical protein [Deltaproteobacteria bacterium]